MLRRAASTLRNLRHLPAWSSLAFDLVEAHEDAARQDYQAAQRRLVRMQNLGLPEHLLKRSTLKLLKALVSLRLGDPKTAAELVPDGVHEVGFLRTAANASERAYLKYAGRLILEEATEQLGEPLTLDVGVEYEDLDIRRVRNSFRGGFPVYRSRYADAPQVQ